MLIKNFKLPAKPPLKLPVTSNGNGFPVLGLFGSSAVVAFGELHNSCPALQAVVKVVHSELLKQDEYTNFPFNLGPLEGMFGDWQKKSLPARGQDGIQIVCLSGINIGFPGDQEFWLYGSDSWIQAGKYSLGSGQLVVVDTFDLMIGRYIQENASKRTIRK